MMNIVTNLSVFTRPEVLVADQTQELQSLLDGKCIATDNIDDEEQLPGPIAPEYVSLRRSFYAIPAEIRTLTEVLRQSSREDGQAAFSTPN